VLNDRERDQLFQAARANERTAGVSPMGLAVGDSITPL
jgi:hypothetical protein